MNKLVVLELQISMFHVSSMLFCFFLFSHLQKRLMFFYFSIASSWMFFLRGQGARKDETEIKL